jgi:prepilin-type N-terminal cleavage/methylation domain-containing protein
MKNFRNGNGFTLVEILVALGLLGGLAVAFSSMISNQVKETKSATETLAILDFQKSLTGALADGNVCTYILNNPTQATFDSTNLPQTVIPSLPIYSGVTLGSPVVPGPVLAEAGKSVSSLMGALKIKSIRLDIVSGAGNYYMGHWLVEFDASNLTREKKPVTVSSILLVDPTVPTSARIKGCVGSNMLTHSTQSCDPGEVVTGFDEDGAIICSQNHVSCPAGQAMNGVGDDGNPICVAIVKPGVCPPGQYMTTISQTDVPKCENASPPKPVNGECGPAHNIQHSEIPAAELCTAGVASEVSGSGPWTWSCVGENGGTSASCTGLFTPPTCRLAYAGHGTSNSKSTVPCKTGETSLKKGKGCPSSMTTTVEFKGLKVKIVKEARWVSSGDHYSDPFHLKNAITGKILTDGNQTFACYYYYHGKPQFGPHAWNICCK